MPLEMLIEEAKGLTDEALLEVVHFVQFLKVTPSNMITTSSTEKKTYRKPGLYKDKIKVAEGFDDPLEEFEEYS